MRSILPDGRKTSGSRLNLSTARHELPDVSRFQITCRAGVLSAAAAAAVVLGAAGPALADVTVDPPSAPQGGGADLTFRVTNSDPSPVTHIKLVLPTDSPIGEVYPLSVDDWAPLIASRTLQEPLSTSHGSTTETAESITWIAMPGKSLAPGKSADLTVAVGPLPTLSSMQFPVQATHADGSAAVAMPPAILKLTPATAADQAAQAAQHAGHEGTDTTTDGTDTSADDSAFAAIVAQSDQGPSGWAISGWILAALAAAAALVAVWRGRRRAAAEPEAQADEPADDAKEPVGAGAGKTRTGGWRYQEPE
jgi:hypothetical protein